MIHPRYKAFRPLCAIVLALHLLTPIAAIAATGTDVTTVQVTVNRTSSAASSAAASASSAQSQAPEQNGGRRGTIERSQQRIRDFWNRWFGGFPAGSEEEEPEDDAAFPAAPEDEPGEDTPAGTEPSESASPATTSATSRPATTRSASDSSVPRTDIMPTGGLVLPAFSELFLWVALLFIIALCTGVILRFFLFPRRDDGADDDEETFAVVADDEDDDEDAMV